MSVTSAELQKDGLGGRATGTEPADVVRAFRQLWRVECSSLADDPKVVLDYFLATTTLPYPGRSYAAGNGSDPESLCVELSADRIGRSPFFDAIATFEPRNASGEQDAGVTGRDEQGKETKDPTKFRDEIEIGWSPITESVEEAIFRGFDPPADAPGFLEVGARSPIINTSRQAIEGVERENHIKIIRISKYRAGYDSALFAQFEAETVNSDIVTIFKIAYAFREQFGPYRGKLVPVPAVLGFLNGILFYRHTLEVHVHPRTWRKVVANLGTDELFRAGDALEGVTLTDNDLGGAGVELRRPITSEEGVPIAAPVPLDAKSKKIADKATPPVWLIWSVYPEAPFAGIQW